MSESATMELLLSGRAAVRRTTRLVRIGQVLVGAGRPVVVQSMTNTDTADDFATSMQIAQLARAGSELVRITVNNDEAARAVPKIREKLLQMEAQLHTRVVGQEEALVAVSDAVRRARTR